MSPDQPPEENPRHRPPEEKPAAVDGGPRRAAKGESSTATYTGGLVADGVPTSGDEKADPPPAWRKIPGIGRMRTAWRAFGASVGVIAAVASVIVGYLAIPKDISAEDWGRRVNAICEQTAAELRDPLRDAAGVAQSLSALLEDPSNARAVAADLTTAAHDIQDAADSYRVVIGQIRALDRPDDTSEIDALLDAGSDLYAALDGVSLGLQSASGTVSSLLENPGDSGLLSRVSDELEALVIDMEEIIATGLPAYQSAIADLDLEQCEVTQAPLPPVSDTLDEEQAALAHRLGFDSVECQPATSPVAAPGALAQLNCTVAEFPDRNPFFISFATLKDLKAWFGASRDRVAKCGSGEHATYDLPDAPHPGRLDCYPADAGAYRVAVMLSDELIGFAAEAEGPSALERWATEFVGQLDPS